MEPCDGAREKQYCGFSAFPHPPPYPVVCVVPVSAMWYDGIKVSVWYGRACLYLNYVQSTKI